MKTIVILRLIKHFLSFWISAIAVQFTYTLCKFKILCFLFSIIIPPLRKLYNMPKSVATLYIFPIIAFTVILVLYFTQPCCVIDCVSALATFYAALVALFVNDYRDYKNRPRLSVKSSDVITTIQNQTWYRLEIFNHGKGIAKNVSVKILSKTNNNFVPIRLTWTHINVPLKDIQPNDSALCDVAIDCPNEFVLCTEVNPKNGSTHFTKNSTSFQITICADNCKIQKHILNIEFFNNVFSLKVSE